MKEVHCILFFKKEDDGLEEYRSNSHKLRELPETVTEERKLEPVVSGQAMAQKKTGLGRVASSIVTESFSSLGNYLLEDWLIPAVKKTIDDLFSNGIHYLLYGKSAEPKSGTLASKISYSGFYQKPYGGQSTMSSSVLDFENIIFSNRGDAEAVLTAMDDIIDRFGVVSVGDLYELSDVQAPSYTVNKYGWLNIRSAEVIRCRDGYMLKLPRPTVLT